MNSASYLKRSLPKEDGLFKAEIINQCGRLNGRVTNIAHLKYELKTDRLGRVGSYVRLNVEKSDHTVEARWGRDVWNGTIVHLVFIDSKHLDSYSTGTEWLYAGSKEIVKNRRLVQFIGQEV